MNIDIELIRSYLEELHITPQTDEDGDLIIMQEADRDFGHDVYILVIVRNNYLRFQAGAPDYKPSEGLDPLYLVNRHNCRRMMPVATVRDGEIRMEYSYLLDEEVSKEYIVENCLKMTIGNIWRGFVELEQPDDR